MTKSLLKLIPALSLTFVAMAAHADQRDAGKGMGRAETKKNSTQAEVVSTFPMADGEVEDVDEVNKSITLKHGPIKTKTIEMEPMTMPFEVTDASLLSNVRVGDKVKFMAEYINGAVTITALKIQK